VGTSTFRTSIVDLAAKLDGVIATVRPCADVVDKINELGNQQDQARQVRAKLRLIPSLPESQEQYAEWLEQVKQLIRPEAGDTERDRLVRKLIYIPSEPTNPLELSAGCASIELQRSRSIAELTQQMDLRAKTIGELQGPHDSAEGQARSFVGELQTILSALPVQPSELLKIRSEIQHLWLLKKVSGGVPFGMRESYSDLLTVRIRLHELLEYLGECPDLR